jgi:hypothetical protein
MYLKIEASVARQCASFAYAALIGQNAKEISMRIVRARFSIRMMPGVGMLGLLGLAVGCSGCGQSMSTESENQQQQDAIRAAMNKAYAHGMAFGRGGEPMKIRRR